MKEEIDSHTGEKWIVLSNEEVKMGFLAQCVEALAEMEGCHFKPTNQICILNQQMLDEHLTYIESIKSGTNE